MSAIGRDPQDPRPLVPDARAALPAVVVKSLGSYPLVYRKRIARVDSKARPGDLVAITSEQGALLGYGLFNPRSEIQLRVLRFGAEPPDEAHFDRLIDRAVSLRRDLLRLDETTDAYRVLHAESDGFPGLVVDRLGDVLSAECFSLGMYQRASAILEKLAARLGTRHTLVRTAPQFLSQEGYDPPELRSDALPPRVVIQESGTRFRVRFEGSHKTGFFCDQRDNRRALAGFCRDRTVLDLCCYTGGFAVQAKKLGLASEVTGVDLDEDPLAAAKDNANLNQVRVQWVQADAFTYMRDRLKHGIAYDVVVLDPPKLIRNREELEEGTRKHFDMAKLAMQLVKPGGLLLACSCAGLLDEAEFVRLLVTASRQVGAALPPDAEGRIRHAPRAMQILAKTGAAADHPVSAAVPETAYLKAVWMRLD